MKIEKPIFIIGSGRSGTSVFYNLLSLHPEVCWFSNLSNKFPEFPQISLAHRILDTSVVGKTYKQKIVANTSKLKIRPDEAEKIYHQYCGFRDDIKSTEKDYDSETVEKFNNIVKAHLKYTGKRRFLNKQTANNQRIRLINEMYKDAYFIHIIRDGRAVANSLLHVDFWNNIIIWWLGQKPPQWAAEGKEPIALCALQWKHDVEEILQNKPLYQDRYIELKYEDFIKDVRGSMAKITNFCELSRSNEFLEILPEKLPDKNEKWKNLSEHQKKVLHDTISGFLGELEYAV